MIQRNRPLGSGVFALVFGIIFLIGTFYVSFSNFKIATSIEPEEILSVYLAISGLILLGWGINRIRYNDGRWIVGQNTINFVMALIATVIAILSILKN